MTRYTTGQAAHAAGISEKAVRMYADRGLVPMERDGVGERRWFTPEAVGTVRIVGLLRAVELRLVDIESVLGARDRVAAFDAVWGERRTRLGELISASELARAALAGSARPDAQVLYRSVPERLTLGIDFRATLADLPGSIEAATHILFGVLRHEQVDLSGSPFVIYDERATDLVPASVSMQVPIMAVVRPQGSTRLSLDDAHDEAFVQLDQTQASDQPFLVTVHDYLSGGTFAADRTPVGNNREIYLPSFGSNQDGPVMEVAVPVTGT